MGRKISVWNISVAALLFAFIQVGTANGETENPKFRPIREPGMEEPEEAMNDQEKEPRRKPNTLNKWLREQTDRQVQLLTRVAPLIERPHRGTAVYLLDASKKIRDAISKDDPYELVDQLEFFKFASIAEQQLWYYFASESFFTTYRGVEAIQPDIDEIYKIYKSISIRLGFTTDSPFKRLQNIFIQINERVDELAAMTIGDDLRKKLVDLKVDLGTAIAAGDSGDGRSVWKAGDRVFQHIQDLYPDFDKFGEDTAAYQVALRIQGLNDIYGRHAGQEDSRPKTTSPNNKSGK